MGDVLLGKPGSWAQKHTTCLNTAVDHMHHGKPAVRPDVRSGLKTPEKLRGVDVYIHIPADLHVLEEMHAFTCACIYKCRLVHLCKYFS